MTHKLAPHRALAIGGIMGNSLTLVIYVYTNTSLRPFKGLGRVYLFDFPHPRLTYHPRKKIYKRKNPPLS